MASNKKQIRKRINGLAAQILIHQIKIKQEMEKFNPDAGLVAKWKKEIRVWQQELARLRKRLKS
jgi:peptidoglycan hydrolase CwlO-like protein